MIRKEDIDDLLSIARVPLDEREETGSFLRWTLERAAPSLGRAGGQRLTPEPHNKYLQQVEDSAEKLQTALKALGENGYVYSDFWLFKGFGPIHGSVFERPHIIKALKDIRLAASGALAPPGGHPPNRSKRNIVDLADSVFETIGGKKERERFVERFYEISCGVGPDVSVESHLKQVRRRKKAGRKSPA